MSVGVQQDYAIESHLFSLVWYVSYRESPLSVHHYIGTQEQWDFRKDARDGMKQRNSNKFAEYGQIQHSYDTSICGWLRDFVKKYGKSQAQRWLDGVGNVSYRPT